jgi:hypothetical protein
MVVGRSFLNPEAGAPDLGFATLEPAGDITARVVAALPPPDVKLDIPYPSIKYIHRSLKDGEVYFFFNESNQAQSRTVTLAGNGQVQVWDATRGTIQPLAGVAKAAGTVAVPLALGPQEARFIVIGALPAGAGGPMTTVTNSQTVAELDGDWLVTLGEKQMTVPLKSWETMGAALFTGTGVYKRTFTAPATLPPDGHVYLDLGNVHEVARVRLNGVELEVRSWPPYVWDVTPSMKSGANTLEVEVRAAPASESRNAFGGGPGGRRSGAPGPEAGAARGFAPTGVPGGLVVETAGNGRGRGGANLEGPPGGTGQAALAAPVIVSGLLGPVRLLAQ